VLPREDTLSLRDAIIYLRLSDSALRDDTTFIEREAELREFASDELGLAPCDQCLKVAVENAGSRRGTIVGVLP